MEENNDDCRTVGDALVYLAGPTHKKYSTTFVWGHPFSTYVSQDRFFNPPSPLYALRVTVTAVELFQKILLNTMAHRKYVLNNMTQKLQVNKNTNIKYNIIQVKLN